MSRYKYVRKQKNRFYARVWINSELGYLNLGGWDSERAAYLVAIEFIRRGTLPPGILPRFVRRCSGGYYATCTVGGRHLRTDVHQDPVEAYKAMVRLRRRRRPLPQSQIADLVKAMPGVGRAFGYASLAAERESSTSVALA